MQIVNNWNLEKYFYKSIHDKDFLNDLNLIDDKLKNIIDTYKWNIKYFQNVKELIQLYNDMEEFDNIIYKPYLYVHYLNSLDTQDLDIIKKIWEFQTMLIKINWSLLFIDQEFKELWYKKLISFTEDETAFNYSNAIINQANSIKYILEESQEYVLNIKSKVLWSFSNFDSEFRNSLEFRFIEDWEEKILTEEEVRSRRMDPNEEIRREAYISLKQVYNNKQNQITFANLYTSIVKNWSTNIQIRWYGTIMEPRNIKEEMENNVVDMLLNKVKDNYNIFQRYISLKKKFMKKNEFYIWDLMAPIHQLDKKYSYEEALNMHLSAMKNFDNEFYEYSKDMITSWRIDVYPKLWKRWWAFASYWKNFDSFVLLNFTWTLRDVSTITHELWHATHWYLSQNNPACVFDSPLSLAETASIFNEMLLTSYLEKKLTDKEKIEFLNKKLEDIFATIFRQIQYVLFEKEVHETIYNWWEYTYKDLNILWRKKQIEMSWQEIIYDVNEEEESTWSNIPHIFHTPFYCYAYSFWNLLTFSLYNLYKKEWKSFVEKYKKILSAWWSKRPKDLLLENWINIESDDFFDSWFKEISLLVDEFESLL